MDGLWTFIISSSSSSSSSDAEEGPTETPRNAAKFSHTQPDGSQRPSAKVTSPTNVERKTRVRSLSDNTEMIERTRLQERSATAPPSAFTLPSYSPQPPRRAISARLERPNTSKKRSHEPESAAVGTSIASSMLDHGQLEVGARRPPPNRHLPQPQRPDVQFNDTEYTKKARLAGSFSQKARVKKTLDDKNLQRLDTTIVDFESRGLLSAPTSMLETPREMYAIPERQSMRQDPTSPQSKDARRTIMFSLRKSSSSTLPPKVQVRRKSQHSGKARQEKDPERQRIYLPGAICLEEDPSMQRRDSVATLNPFDEGIEPRCKQFSDMIMLDSITMYFEELCIVQDATEQCLDQYWKDASRAPHRVTGSRPPSVTSPEESDAKSPIRPHNGRSPRSSRFSFSSASSTSSQPRPGTPMRQRDRLRRLLSPAFPGSAFLKTSSDWGQ